MTTDLVQSISITNLLNQRESVRASLEAARAALLSADEIIKSIDARTPNSRLYRGVACIVCRDMSHLFRLLDPDGVAAGMRDFDGLAWRHLMRESGILSFMDATSRKQWEESIQKGEAPELTAENIEATFGRLYSDRGDMFERGVVSCFRRLSWDYKTNLPQKFGKRIVVTYLCGYHSHNKCDELDDLVRVMHVLDGKPEPDHRRGIYSLLNAERLNYERRAGTIETDFLHIRVFKNGNGHVTFKRPDLVEQMNRIIAKHHPNALPEPK